LGACRQLRLEQAACTGAQVGAASLDKVAAQASLHHCSLLPVPAVAAPPPVLQPPWPCPLSYRCSCPEQHGLCSHGRLASTASSPTGDVRVSEHGPLKHSWNTMVSRSVRYKPRHNYVLATIHVQQWLCAVRHHPSSKLCVHQRKVCDRQAANSTIRQSARHSLRTIAMDPFA
jgi:hypothetical protein